MAYRILWLRYPGIVAGGPIDVGGLSQSQSSQWSWCHSEPYQEGRTWSIGYDRANGYGKRYMSGWSQTSDFQLLSGVNDEEATDRTQHTNGSLFWHLSRLFLLHFSPHYYVVFFLGDVLWYGKRFGRRAVEYLKITNFVVSSLLREMFACRK